MKYYILIVIILSLASSCIFKREAQYLETSKKFLSTWQSSETKKCRYSRDSTFKALSLKLPPYDTFPSMNVLLIESVNRINGTYDKCMLNIDTLKAAKVKDLKLKPKKVLGL